MTRKKRSVYPDVPAPLAHPIVDDHTHLPVPGARAYPAAVAEGETGPAATASPARAGTP